MERLFKTHYNRRQECLDGQWDFCTTDIFELPKQYNDSMTVPSCWEMNIKYCNYSGYAAYRRTIEIDTDSNIRFVFKGVSHTCKVYLDGNELGSHYSAYSAFSVIAYSVTKGTHSLEVLIDNSYSENSRLHIFNDYFTYGGITRPVFLEYIDNSYIERMEFEPYFKNNKWYAGFRIFINNLNTNNSHILLHINCAGVNCTLEKGEIKGNQIIFYDFQ